MEEIDNKEEEEEEEEKEEKLVLNSSIIKLLNNTRNFKFYLQIVGYFIKKQDGKEDQYIVELSDGKNIIKTYFIKKLNKFFHENEDKLLEINSIIEIEEFNIIPLISENNITIINVVISKINILKKSFHKIGNPENYNLRIENYNNKNTYQKEIKENKNDIVTNDRKMVKNQYDNSDDFEINNNIKIKLKSEIKNSFLTIDKLEKGHYNWIFEAYIFGKSKIVNFPNGKLFNLYLIDKSGNQIQAIFFNQAVDKFYCLEENNYFSFSGGIINQNKNDYSIVNNPLQINFNEKSIINKIDDDNYGFENIIFEHQLFKDLKNLIGKMTYIDIIGYVSNIESISEIKSKNGSNIKKRVFMMTNDNNENVEITLWGDNCDPLPWGEEKNPILILKGLKLGSYNNKINLGFTNSTLVKVNKNMKILQNLYEIVNKLDNQNHTDEKSIIKVNSIIEKNFESITISELLIKNENPQKMLFGTQSSNNVYKIVAYIHNIPNNDNYYYVCPTSGCNKKLNKISIDTFSCLNCGEHTKNPQQNCMINFSIKDYSEEEIWITAFGNEAEKILLTIQDKLHLENNFVFYIREKFDFKNKKFRFTLTNFSELDSSETNLEEK